MIPKWPWPKLLNAHCRDVSASKKKKTYNKFLRQRIYFL